MKRMNYPRGIIEDVKKKLLELSMKDKTPKMFSVQMFQAYEIILQLQGEIKKYEQLGTLEEVREAVERQQEKKPSPMLGIYGRVYECKECGNELEMYSKYCPFCGQKQEWE